MKFVEEKIEEEHPCAWTDERWREGLMDPKRGGG